MSIEILDLPEIDEFDEAERLMARVLVGRCRSGGAMIGGTLAEARVASVLPGGVEWPRLGIASWDLRWRGVRLQIRSSTEDGSFTLAGPGCDAFVFVDRNPAADRFIVAGGEEVATIARGSMRARKLAERFGTCGGDELAERIAAVASSSD